MAVQRALQALGEPTRFRILQLLRVRPHTVGEVAAALGTLQPQTTKHLQVLEATGVIRIHALGRRRVARLDRDTLAELAAYFNELAMPADDDAVLEDYQRAITRLATEETDTKTLVLRFERTFTATAARVWQAWIDPVQASTWWAPRYFTVAAFEFEPRVGATIRLVLTEGDGGRHESRGQVEQVALGRLGFLLSPVDAAGEPLFHARHTLTLTATEAGDTDARLVVEVTYSNPEAAPAVAGLEPGWQQLLDNLDRHLRQEIDTQKRQPNPPLTE